MIVRKIKKRGIDITICKYSRIVLFKGIHILILQMMVSHSSGKIRQEVTEDKVPTFLDHSINLGNGTHQKSSINPVKDEIHDHYIESFVAIDG